jgi:hypothetical protein
MKRSNSPQKPPGLWVNKAFEDYAAGRCLLLNGLFAGFVMSQQAIEKMLKAYLHIAYPERTKFVGQSERVLSVTPGHDLVAHALLVEKAFPHLSFNMASENRALLELLSYHFHRKYPDNETPFPSSTTTALLEEIDSVMVWLSLNLPVAADSRWRLGVFHAAWPLVLTNQPNPPSSLWVLESNKALAAAFDDIREVIVNGHELCYPGQPL